MKIESIYLHNLRNDAHFQYHEEFIVQVEIIGAEALNIDWLFEEYLRLYEQEKEALTKMNKSVLTDRIKSADRRRDKLFRGMIDSNKSALNHYREDVQKAAERLKILFDAYGNLSRKSLNEQTAAMTNLLQELNGKFADDASLTGVADWTTELAASNETCKALIRERNIESAKKTDLVLKQVRREVDAAYRKIINRINALALLNENEDYSKIVRMMNVIIDKYSATLAQQSGRNRKKVMGEQE